MRNGDFTSLQDLRDKLRWFVDHYDQTFAMPVHWKKDGSGKRFCQATRPETWRKKQIA